MQSHRCRASRWYAALVGLLCVLPALQAQQPEKPAPADWFKALSWRCIGPANMGGRITAISVFEADPTTYWVATASGGLLKTTNNGVTFEHQFDHEATVSIGAVCVAPSNREVVWVGTGENNPRNSVSYGDGVYKSTDGGKNWKNVGLKKTFQIGQIAVHPTNPDLVYVGALGRLYGPSEERGLYKTTDGGTSWEKVLNVDDRTGIIDVKMSPADPETLLVASYERQRDGFDVNEPAKRYGAGSALYKTSDGGKSFHQLTRGLPTCKLGRIGIDYFRKDPNTVFVILESERIGEGPAEAAATAAYLGVESEDAERGARVTRVTANSPAEKAGLQADDVILSLGDRNVTSNQSLTDAINAHKSGDKLKVKLRRGQEAKEIDLTFGTRAAAPAGANRPFSASLAGQQENVQNRQGPEGYQSGGIYKSTDGGESWTRVNSLNPRPMYFSHVRVDPSDDQNLYVCGVSMYRSTDGGKTFRADASRGVHSDQHALWIDPKDGRHMILGCDGGYYVTYDRTANWDHLNTMAIGQFYHVALDSRRDYHAYGGLQDNGSWGGPSLTRNATGPVNEDWVNVGGADGFTCRVDAADPDLVYSTGQNGAMRRRNLRTGEQSAIRPPAVEGQRERFNWNTPFILSSHNSRIFYCAGSHVFRSLDRGNDLRAISPEITRTGRGSATALAESPRNPDVLYVGTDEGALWVTRDGGKAWTDITKNLALPGPRWLASIEASRFAEGRAYVVCDGHRSDDDDPYVLVTEDFGKSWKSLRANLPWGSTRVLREDIQNANLLYLGTEFGAWCSLDRGASWVSLNTNLPTVAVHEFAVHPTAGEVVAATHGRSLWILDVAALRQMTPEGLKEKVQLYKPAAAVRWIATPTHGRTNRRFVGQNPPNGALVYYSLPKDAQKVSLKILDVDGKVVRELSPGKEAGLHRVIWNLTQAQGTAGGDAATQPQGRGGRQGGGGRGGRGGRGGGEFGRPVPAGRYRVVLTVDGQELRQNVQVEGEAGTAPPGSADEEENLKR